MTPSSEHKVRRFIFIELVNQLWYKFVNKRPTSYFAQNTDGENRSSRSPSTNDNEGQGVWTSIRYLRRRHWSTAKLPVARTWPTMSTPQYYYYLWNIIFEILNHDDIPLEYAAFFTTSLLNIIPMYVYIKNGYLNVVQRYDMILLYTMCT